ncbi:hypothetical protein CDL15_Pgr020210 [Punica granatum]|uniref:Pectinesterase n=1 Tax=Punica granatum TaxID=22663 RepID=A0A218VRE2_PUNGR|nr:hypothetical protein CDL15_Pgr020210 [Punica granatum]
MSYGSDSNKKKRLAIVVVSSFILVVIGVAVTVGVTRHQDDQDNSGGGDSHPTTSNKAVQAMCQPTDYKEACIESLSGAGDITDPKQLIKAGFEFTKKKLDQIAENSKTLKEAEKDPMAKQALDICRDQMELAMDHLEESFNRIGALDITKTDDVLDDLETWLSSVLTYQGTCLDEFENVTSPAAPKIREALNSTIKFSSNALVMVKELSSIFKKLNIPGFKNRRLLQEEVLGHGEFPTWMDPVRRRLLADETKPILVIAQDGSGDVRSFTEAIPRLPLKSMIPIVVHVKAGIYRETVKIPKNVWNITWIGDGADKTRITFNKNFADGVKTMYTATFSKSIFPYVYCIIRGPKDRMRVILLFIVCSPYRSRTHLQEHRIRELRWCHQAPGSGLGR